MIPFRSSRRVLGLAGVLLLGSQALAQQHVHTPRCNMPTLAELEQRYGLDFGPGDCTLNFSNPSSMWDPTSPSQGIAEYQLVFHVITPPGQAPLVDWYDIHSQVEILNEVFSGLPGSSGSYNSLGTQGGDTRIRFKLADRTPSGAPTTGITRRISSLAFMDQGSYWNSYAWDTRRYINVYVNEPADPQTGAPLLGYVNRFPAQPVPNNNREDRINIHWATVGWNGSFPNANQGNTLVHEMGHFFGLYHVFMGGCNPPGTDPYAVGDLLYDTGSQQVPIFNCNNATGCGSLPPNAYAPTDNYMGYQPDSCMVEFTPEQIRRMRCSLTNYRTTLTNVPSDGFGEQGFCNFAPNGQGQVGVLRAYGSSRAVDNNLTIWASGLPINQFSMLLCARGLQPTLPTSASYGSPCIGPVIGRFLNSVAPAVPFDGTRQFQVDISAMPLGSTPVGALAGETWTFQFWSRDVLPGGGAGYAYSQPYSIQFE